MARVIGAIVSLIVGLGALVFIGLGVAVNGSLPRLEGRTIIAGLEAPVAVDRDVEGVPTLAGQNRRDVARALGYLHAQERYFQMDLMRRRAAGLLAELFGEPALAWDRRVRAHQLGHTAGEIVAALPTEHRALIDAYVEGVNAGLEDLDTPPVEYLLLRTAPEPWTAEDVILVVHAMFLELTPWGGEGDLARATMQEIIPPEVTAFLGPTGSEFDAPVEGEPLVVPPMPGPDVMDLRAMAEAAPVEDAPQPGSNAWAVAGSRTAHGGALLANDMHLGLGVPNTWYRVRMQWSDDAGAEHDVVGVTLPGAPLLIVGSTGRIAWGFTNSYIDTSDAVVLAMVGPDIYESPDGPRPFELRREVFQVAGGDPVEVDYPWTEWGPVVGEDHRGRPVVVRWTAHFPEAVNLNLQQLETAANVDEALAIAGTCGIPPQNLVVADLGGRVGWTVAGQVPRRIVDLDGTSSWDGWLTPDEVPRIDDPADGLIWTANARVVGGEALDLLGDGGYALGSRAGQIRDGLRSLEQPAEAEMLALQLDDRALFLEWWRQHLLALLDDAAIDGHPLRADARRLIDGWSGRAAVDDPGYRLVRGFRLYARSRVLEPLTAACAAVDSPCGWDYYGQRESAVRTLLESRPVHLLNPQYESWRALELGALDHMLEEFAADGTALADRRWGERNTVRVNHPMTPALPSVVADWFNMPARPLPGDWHMPRVQSPTFGASERLVVSPGREEYGLFHMPAGQSGHPRSPYYGAGHEAWENGEPTPLLPGPTKWRLELVPG